MIKRLLIAIVLLAVLAGGIVGFNLFRENAIEQFFANMPVPSVTVSAVDVEEQNWTPSIEAIGTVNASRGVDLTVETTGIVTAIHFSANQQVAEGAVLLQLEDRVQQADLQAARTQATLDKQSQERARALQRRGVGSNVTLDAADAAAAASAAQVDKLEAVLEQRQLQAPFGGTIGIPRVDKGQYLSPGTTVATLQDLETMRADFTVPEQQLGLLTIGQPVRLTLDDQDAIFTGKVIGIDPKVDPSSRLVSVRAEISNPEGRLAPGQFARIKVDLPSEDDVIALPQTAVVTSLYGDHVYAVREAKVADKAAEATGNAEAAGEEKDAATKLEVRQVFVKVGRRFGDLVEILSGVSIGDQVVTAGQNRLANGTPVTIDNTVSPTGTPADNEAGTAEAEAQ